MGNDNMATQTGSTYSPRQWCILPTFQRESLAFNHGKLEELVPRPLLQRLTTGNGCRNRKYLYLWNNDMPHWNIERQFLGLRQCTAYRKYRHAVCTATDNWKQRHCRQTGNIYVYGIPTTNVELLTKPRSVKVLASDATTVRSTGNGQISSKTLMVPLLVVAIAWTLNPAVIEKPRMGWNFVDSVRHSNWDTYIDGSLVCAVKRLRWSRLLAVVLYIHHVNRVNFNFIF